MPRSCAPGRRWATWRMVDTMIKDGLWDAFHGYHMGTTAENVAEKYQITREQQDAFAAASQRKAGEAMKAGRFKDEIAPVTVKGRKGDVVDHPTTNTRKPSTDSRCWQAQARPSARTAPSPPAMPPASVTAPRRSW